MELNWIRAKGCSAGSCVEVAWRKSSYSAATNSVEVGWTSGRCATGGCVEVAHDGGRVLVRDSKRAESPVVEFDRPGWAGFLDLAPRWDRTETVELTGGNTLGLCLADSDPVCIRSEAAHLHFSWDEWDEFLKGIDEFNVEVLEK